MQEKRPKMAKNAHDYALHGQKNRKKRTSDARKPKICMVKRSW